MTVFQQCLLKYLCVWKLIFFFKESLIIELGCLYINCFKSNCVTKLYEIAQFTDIKP